MDSKTLALLNELRTLEDETRVLFDSVQDSLELHRVGPSGVVTDRLTRCALLDRGPLRSLQNWLVNKPWTMSSACERASRPPIPPRYSHRNARARIRDYAIRPSKSRPQIHAKSLIFLNGNAGPLTAKLWSEQRDWYKQELNSLAKEVLGVIVFVHQAPLTNGSVVSDDEKVLNDFVPMFANNEKTMAMLSGHSHTYERFERGAKTYIVTGGGGGPRHPLLQGSKRRHTDDRFNGPAMRNFNFIEFTVYSQGLHAEVVGLPKGGSSFCRMETFDLLWPGGKIAAETPSPIGTRSERAGLIDCYPQSAPSG